MHISWNPDNNYRSITAFFLVCVTISFFFLSRQEALERNMEVKNGWWAAYFNDPNGKSLNFTIENNTDSTRFRYTLYQDRQATETSSFLEIPKNTGKSISISIPESKHDWRIEIQDEQQQVKSLIKRFK